MTENIYVTPELEITEFDTEDVITTSINERGEEELG